MLFQFITLWVLFTVRRNWTENIKSARSEPRFERTLFSKPIGIDVAIDSGFILSLMKIECSSLVNLCCEYYYYLGNDRYRALYKWPGAGYRMNSYWTPCDVIDQRLVRLILTGSLCKVIHSVFIESVEGVASLRKSLPWWSTQCMYIYICIFIPWDIWLYIYVHLWCIISMIKYGV